MMKNPALVLSLLQTFAANALPQNSKTFHWHIDQMGRIFYRQSFGYWQIYEYWCWCELNAFFWLSELRDFHCDDMFCLLVIMIKLKCLMWFNLYSNFNVMHLVSITQQSRQNFCSGAPYGQHSEYFCMEGLECHQDSLVNLFDIFWFCAHWVFQNNHLQKMFILPLNLYSFFSYILSISFIYEPLKNSLAVLWYFIPAMHNLGWNAAKTTKDP